MKLDKKQLFTQVVNELSQFRYGDICYFLRLLLLLLKENFSCHKYFRDMIFLIFFSLKEKVILKATPQYLIC